MESFRSYRLFAIPNIPDSGVPVFDLAVGVLGGAFLSNKLGYGYIPGAVVGAPVVLGAEKMMALKTLPGSSVAKTKDVVGNDLGVYAKPLPNFKKVPDSPAYSIPTRNTNTFPDSPFDMRDSLVHLQPMNPAPYIARQNISRLPPPGPRKREVISRPVNPISRAPDRRKVFSLY